MSTQAYRRNGDGDMDADQCEDREAESADCGPAQPSRGGAAEPEVHTDEGDNGEQPGTGEEIGRESCRERV